MHDTVQRTVSLLNRTLHAITVHKKLGNSQQCVL